MKLLTVTIYKDTTGLFTETECTQDNLIDVEIPYWVLKSWYDDHPDLVSETAYELGMDAHEVTFWDWYNNVIWVENVDGLYEYSKSHGCIPTFL